VTKLAEWWRILRHAIRFLKTTALDAECWLMSPDVAFFQVDAGDARKPLSKKTPKQLGGLNWLQGLDLNAKPYES